VASALHGADLREFNDEDDHVHLLGEYPPKVPVPALVNPLKGVPARRLRPEFTGRVNQHIMHGHFWSPSLLRRTLRPRAAEHHPAVHRAAKTPG
jgi:REP element-mobilizing transposase RayT